MTRRFQHPARFRRRFLPRCQRPDAARGFVAAEWALAIGVIIIPVTLLVVSFPVWIERQSVARRAANEAARAFVLASSEGEGERAAGEVVEQIRQNYGLAPGQLSAPAIDGRLARGEVVTVSVTVTMPAISIPLWEVSAGSWEWTATHAERVDDYRSFPG